MIDMFYHILCAALLCKLASPVWQSFCQLDHMFRGLFRNHNLDLSFNISPQNLSEIDIDKGIYILQV